VWLAEVGRAVPCCGYDRARLGPGHRLAGPALVDQMDATTLLLPGQSAVVDPFLNLLVEA
jgi:N-methylhydantoinase A